MFIYFLNGQNIDKNSFGNKGRVDRLELMKFLSTVSRGFLGAFLEGYMLLPAYILFVYLIRKQYERSEQLLDPRFEAYYKPLKQKVEESVFFGLLAGFAGSLISVAIGITVSSETFQYLFAVMLILMFINIRFVCFSYAAAILVFVNLVFHSPGLDVPSLLALAGIIHLMESVLVYFNSGKDSMPVFVRYGRGIAGGYVIQKFWPVPVVFLTMLLQGGNTGAGILGDTVWWPAFLQGKALAGLSSLALDCGLAVVGYSNFALTKLPEKRSRETAYQIFAYSLILLACAYASVHIYFFKIVGAVALVALHEIIILYGRYREMHGEPLFLPSRQGVKILETLPGGHAERMGLKGGDTILSINGNAIRTEAGIAGILEDYPNFIWVSVLDDKGAERIFEFKCYPGGMGDLGIIIVPRETEVTYNISSFESIDIVRNLVARFRGFGGKSV